MKKDMKHKILHEYAEFLTGQEVCPPEFISIKIKDNIHKKLNPSPWLVFLRLASVVFIIGILNLFLCPQFGVGFIRNSGLHEVFMQFGRYGCRFFCGVFFLGSGLLLASLLLSIEDLKVLRKHRFLELSALSSLALVFFIAIGSQVYFEAAFFWLLGALVGGTFSLEMVYLLRYKYSLIKA